MARIERRTRLFHLLSVFIRVSKTDPPSYKSVAFLLPSTAQLLYFVLDLNPSLPSSVKIQVPIRSWTQEIAKISNIIRDRVLYLLSVSLSFLVATRITVPGTWYTAIDRSCDIAKVATSPLLCIIVAPFTTFVHHISSKTTMASAAVMPAPNGTVSTKARRSCRQ
jgi:predicted ferric reductase